MHGAHTYKHAQIENHDEWKSAFRKLQSLNFIVCYHLGHVTRVWDIADVVVVVAGDGGAGATA